MSYRQPPIPAGYGIGPNGAINRSFPNGTVDTSTSFRELPDWRRDLAEFIYGKQSPPNIREWFGENEPRAHQLQPSDVAARSLAFGSPSMQPSEALGMMGVGTMGQSTGDMTTPNIDQSDPGSGRPIVADLQEQPDSRSGLGAFADLLARVGRDTTLGHMISRHNEAPQQREMVASGGPNWPQREPIAAGQGGPDPTITIESGRQWTPGDTGQWRAPMLMPGQQQRPTPHPRPRIQPQSPPELVGPTQEMGPPQPRQPYMRPDMFSSYARYRAAANDVAGARGQLNGPMEVQTTPPQRRGPTYKEQLDMGKSRFSAPASPMPTGAPRQLPAMTRSPFSPFV